MPAVVSAFTGASRRSSGVDQAASGWSLAMRSPHSKPSSASWARANHPKQLASCSSMASFEERIYELGSGALADQERQAAALSS
jgi:hypothetical protein